MFAPRGFPPRRLVLPLGQESGRLLPLRQFLCHGGGKPGGQGQIDQTEHAAVFPQHLCQLIFCPGQRHQRRPVSVQKTAGSLCRIGGGVRREQKQLWAELKPRAEKLINEDRKETEND